MKANIAPVWNGFKYDDGAQIGYVSWIQQGYTGYKPKAGMKATGLAIAFSGNLAIASWNAVPNAVSYDVAWKYMLNTTGGAKWFDGEAKNVGNVRETQWNVPSGAVAVDIYVRPVSGTYTFQWQTYEVETETSWLGTRHYYIYTTHSEQRAYFEGAYEHIGGGKPTAAADSPSTPASPALTLGSGGRVTVEISSTAGDHFKVWLGLYMDGAWGNHTGGRTYGPYNAGEVDIANVFVAERGHAYRMDARQQNTALGVYSDYSGFSETLEMPPSTPADLNVVTLSSSAFQASWTKVDYTGDSYELRWAADPEGMTLDEPPEGVESANVVGGATVYSAVLAAGTWYFCVRAKGEGNSDWTEIKEVVLGLAPLAPTLGMLPPFVKRGDTVNLTWTYNNSDGSAQAQYEVQMDDGGGWDTIASGAGQASSLAIDTSELAPDSAMRLRARTMGATGEWGDYAVSAAIQVKEPIMATVEVTQSAIPVTLDVSASADVRTWHVIITSVADATTTLIDGTPGILPAGTVAFEGMVSYGDEDFDPRALELELDFTTATFAQGVNYLVTLTVVSVNGLTDTDTAEFVPEWDSSAPVPVLVVPDPSVDLIAHIFPICYDYDAEPEEGEYPLRDDVTLAVYRFDCDGKMLLVADDLENTGNVEVIDPHPSFGECWYRVIARAQDGSVGFMDSSCRVNCESVVIQFESSLKPYDEPVGFDEAGFIKLPYNIELSEKYSPDASLVQFIGNSDPTLYTGTQRGRTATAKSLIVKSDDITLVDKVRTLAGSMTKAYYRDPSGLGFWAWIVPSLKPMGPDMTSVDLNVTRIMGDFMA